MSYRKKERLPDPGKDGTSKKMKKGGNETVRETRIKNQTRAKLSNAKNRGKSLGAPSSGQKDFLLGRISLKKTSLKEQDYPKKRRATPNKIPPIRLSLVTCKNTRTKRRG